MKETTKEWLNFAKADLLNCELILNEESLTSIAAFHSQQAAEKAFKAWMEERGLIIPRIHNLQRLCDIADKDIVKEIDQDELALLDTVYINSRYPGDLGMLDTGKPTREEAKELYESAKKIFSILLSSIEKM